MAVCDRKGTIYEAESFLVSDIYTDEAELMKSAYYAKKIPEYEKGLKNRAFNLVSFYTARERIKELIKKYNVEAVCAYNANFDYKALNTTQRYLTKSKYRYFLPYGTKVFCIWHMACQVICTQSRYIKFCLENDFISKRGNIFTNAETVYRYMTKDETFDEAHTGLNDVLIEVQIMAHCFRQKKKMAKNINRACWRIPQPKAKEVATEAES